MTYCIECRQELPANSRFCLRCGASQSVKTTSSHNSKADFTGSLIDPLKHPGRCPECHSRRVVGDITSHYIVNISPQGAKPKLWIGIPFSKVQEQVLVCPTCGYVAFFVQKPEIFDPESPEDNKK